jgi:glycosyltransferase involved in cell wall biosynthesis
MPDVVIEDVHGLFVPLRDPGAIALAIARLDADRTLLAQMSSACRRRIAGRYTAERMAGDIGRLYSDLFDVKQARVLRRS